MKSIPGPSGKRRNDGLLSQNRETLELKVQPDATLSNLYPGYSTFSPNHFLCTSEKIKRKINLRVRKRTVGNGEKLNNFLISFQSSLYLIIDSIFSQECPLARDEFYRNPADREWKSLSNCKPGSDLSSCTQRFPPVLLFCNNRVEWMINSSNGGKRLRARKEARSSVD